LYSFSTTLAATIIALGVTEIGLKYVRHFLHSFVRSTGLLFGNAEHWTLRCTCGTLEKQVPVKLNKG
jgi:hypothetical protein